MGVPATHTMARKAEGSKYFVSQPVIDEIKKSKPVGMSETGWVSYLIQLGIIAVEKNGL